jgi:hypothetical protein
MTVMGLSHFVHQVPPFFFPSLLAACLAAGYGLAALDPQRPKEPGGWLGTLLPLLLAAPALSSVLLSIRSQISNHGFFHSGYVLQLLRGVLPPENPTLPGEAANDYWPYHALLAAGVAPSDLPIPLASTLLNLLCLILCLWFAGELSRPPRSGMAGGAGDRLLVLFGGSALCVPAALWWGRLGPTTAFAGDRRLDCLLEKFLNFNGFPLGVMLFLACLLLGRRLLADGFSAPRIFLLALCLTGALALHATTGLFLWLTVPTSLVATLGLTGRGPALRNFLPSLALVPALWAILHFLRDASLRMEGGARLDPSDILNWRSLLGTSLLVLPLLYLSLRRALREKDAPQMFTCFCALGGYALSLCVSLPGGNEYKFTHLAVVAAWVAALSTLRDLDARPVLRLIRPTLLVLVGAALLLTGTARWRDPRTTDDTFFYRDGRLGSRPVVVAERPDQRYADLFQWARDHTPADTLVLLPLQQKNHATLFLLSERLPFLVNGDIYNRGSEAYPVRKALLESLYDPSLGPKEVPRILDAVRSMVPRRPLFLVVPHSIRDRGSLLGEPSVKGDFGDGFLVMDGADRIGP